MRPSYLIAACAVAALCAVPFAFAGSDAPPVTKRVATLEKQVAALKSQVAALSGQLATLQTNVNNAGGATSTLSDRVHKANVCLATITADSIRLALAAAGSSGGNPQYTDNGVCQSIGVVRPTPGYSPVDAYKSFLVWAG